jgi:hypothetical protein
VRVFDYLVSTGEDRRWDGEAKRLGGLEIETSSAARLASRRAWHLAGPVDEIGRAVKQLLKIDAARHQQAVPMSIDVTDQEKP